MKFESSQEYFEPSTKPAEQKMKLEVGKRYVMRSKLETGPLTKDVGNAPYTLVDTQSGMTWTHDGKWWADGRESPFDIVAEYVAPQEKQKVKKVLWLRGPVNEINTEGNVLLEKQWIAEGARPTNVASGWLIRTDVVREFDE